MEEQWLTVQEAATLSHYHPEHLRELLRDGKIKGRKFGIVWQVDRTSLTEYVEMAKNSEDKRHGPKALADA